MSIVQNTMIALARNASVSRFMRSAGARSALATRFIGGADVEVALTTAKRLVERHGIRASLFYLGEYVVDRTAIEYNVNQVLAAIDTLGRARLDVHVSIDPTAIGFMEDDTFGTANATLIAQRVACQPSPPGTGNKVMLDMEDLSILDRTCRLHALLHAKGLLVALTLQAQRRRTLDDLGKLVCQSTSVRLVKGAFPESTAHDYQGRACIDRGYLNAAHLMLSPEARDAGFYPARGRSRCNRRSMSNRRGVQGRSSFLLQENRCWGEQRARFRSRFAQARPIQFTES